MTRSSTLLILTLLLAFLALLASPAPALIMVGRGDTPVPDSDWPAGSLDVANLSTRVGYWEGPPFGGGQSQFLYRGDNSSFQASLDLFAEIRAPELQLIIREGPQTNQFLKDDRDPNADTSVDWTFAVWTPRNWNQRYNDPNSIFESQDPSGAFRHAVAPPTLRVYVAGPNVRGIDWKSIKVPAGLTVIDERATSNGYAPEDGSVIRGGVYDMNSAKPISDVTISVETYDGKAYRPVTAGKADVDGRFEIKHVPPGSYRVTFAAPNYVSRILSANELGPNTLLKYSTSLTGPVSVKGTVRDTQGKPLAGVKIRPDSILGFDGRGYTPVTSLDTTTDAQGAFEVTGLPKGYLQLFSSDPNHQAVNLSRIIEAPAANVTLVMTATGSIKGTVIKPDGTPADKGTVNVTPLGEVAGQWGGGMNIKPDGTFEFTNVPPGKYILSTDSRSMIPGGPPNPLAKTIEVKAGEVSESQLSAK